MEGDLLNALLPFLLIGAAFWLFIIRPQRLRARQAQQVQSSLAPGVRVMTTAGLFGTVSEIADDTVLIEVSPGVTNRYLKAAVARVVEPLTQPVGDNAEPPPAP